MVKLVNCFGKQFLIDSSYVPEYEINKTQEELAITGSKEERIAIIKKLHSLFEQWQNAPVEPISTETLFFSIVGDKAFLKKEDGTLLSIPFPKELAEMVELFSKPFEKEAFNRMLLRFFKGQIDKPIEKTIHLLEELIQLISSTVLNAELYEKYKKAGYTDKEAKEMATVPSVSITSEGVLVLMKVVELVDESLIFTLNDSKDGSKAVLNKGFTRVVNQKTGETTIVDERLAEELKFVPVVMRKTGDPYSIGGVITHEFSLGDIVEVSTNRPHHVGCYGIHVGNQQFAYHQNGYNNKAMTLLVYVCPTTITDVNANSGALTCSSMMPFSLLSNDWLQTTIFTLSSYLAKTNKEYEELKASVLKKYEELVKDLRANY